MQWIAAALELLELDPAGLCFQMCGRPGIQPDIDSKFAQFVNLNHHVIDSLPELPARPLSVTGLHWYIQSLVHPGKYSVEGLLLLILIIPVLSTVACECQPSLGSGVHTCVHSAQGAFRSAEKCGLLLAMASGWRVCQPSETVDARTESVTVEVLRGLYFRRGDGIEPLNAVSCCPLAGQAVVQCWFGKVCSQWQLEIFGGTKNKMDNQTWYLRTSKLALALAIIRSKPADKSSREYTEHLARMVSGQESRWRSKVEALEAEVLQLRQKLLLSRIFSGSFKSGDPSSQLQAQEPKSSENTPTLLEDSGCYLSSEQQTPSEMPQCCGESQIPTPFSSLPIGSKPCAPPEEPLSSHMQFLQHLLGLKNLTESEYLKTDLSHFENASATISDSVFQLLEGLIAFYRAPKLPCSSFWTEAIDTLARLIGDCNLSNHILRKCSKKLEEFEKTLVQVILRNNHINRPHGPGSPVGHRFVAICGSDLSSRPSFGI
ncbi:PREDICTED: meiosis-specific protein MEI4-like [Capra hircus]|uniref:meiosis-specific protein MEI4-like n=1 Tax=Capra hircus TaxID=9925 RepID=UPI0008474E89|nr:PREDICTED: meiosis-specific protein MEI4-like [Capra hircus]